MMSNGIVMVENYSKDNIMQKEFTFYDFKSSTFFKQVNEQDKVNMNFSDLYTCQEEVDSQDNNIECVWYDKGNELILKNFTFNRL